MKVYWNGEIIDESKVSISPWDLGFLRGYGIFEYIAIYDGKPFMLDLHLDRLENSAREIDLSLRILKGEFVKVITELIEENRVMNGAIRIVATGGTSPDGITKGEETTLLIRPEISSKHKDELYEKGGALITVEYERGTPRSKTTQYIEAIRHGAQMRESGAIEILYTKNGKISECSRSNIFIVSQNNLVTAKQGILLGITRGLVLKLAQELQIPIYERDVYLSELMSAEEVFITGTGKKILPITSINGQSIAGGTPGRITKQVILSYEERTRG